PRGMFFSGNFIVGDLQTLLVNEHAAEAKVHVAEIAMQQAETHHAALTYRAPYNGEVLRLFKSTGMTVDRGEGMLVLRRNDGELFIDAYLTQDEVERLQAGSWGRAYVPPLNRYYDVQIVTLDRTAGFLKDVEQPKLVRPEFNWRGADDPSAHAKLAFVNLAPQDRAQMLPGMPVSLN